MASGGAVGGRAVDNGGLAPQRRRTGEDQAAERRRAVAEVEESRRQLMASGALARPSRDSGTLRCGLRPFSKSKRSPPPAARADRGCSDAGQFRPSYWSHSHSPLKQPLLAHATDSAAGVAVKFFASLLLVLAAESPEDPAVVRTVQAMLQKCLGCADLRDELFLQLLKQTTDCADACQARAYQLLGAACSLLTPSRASVQQYLASCLRRAAVEASAPAGQSAQFCLRRMSLSAGRPPRRFPPSACELAGIFARADASTSVQLLNGESRRLQFHAFTTGEEAVAEVRARVPLGDGAVGWALFEQFGVMERYTNPADYVGDLLFKWEQFAQLNCSPHQLRLVFKKRLFVSPFVDAGDAAEVQLVAHQCLTEVFEGRIPLEPWLAQEICGIRAAREGTDASVVMRVLPRSWRDSLAPAEVDAAASRHAAGLSGSQEERQLQLDLRLLGACQSWRYFGCALFEARAQQPPELAADACLLAVGQSGLHLLRHLRQEPLLTCDYAQLLAFNTESRYLLCAQTSTARLALYSKQATQAAYLIRDYMTRVVPGASRSVLRQSAGDTRRHSQSAGSESAGSDACLPPELQRQETQL